jgi:hypothetical protein
MFRMIFTRSGIHLVLDAKALQLAAVGSESTYAAEAPGPVQPGSRTVGPDDDNMEASSSTMGIPSHGDRSSPDGQIGAD